MRSGGLYDDRPGDAASATALARPAAFLLFRFAFTASRAGFRIRRVLACTPTPAPRLLHLGPGLAGTRAVGPLPVGTRLRATAPPATLTSARAAARAGTRRFRLRAAASTTGSTGL